MKTFDLDTWIVSDTHFRHKNIIKYCNRPMGHDRLMQQNWFEQIQPEDTVLHLGDLQVWYGLDVVAASAITSSLPGQKFILRGNHDREKPKFYADLGFTMIPEFVQEFGDAKNTLQRVLFSHWPDVDRIGSWDINIHGHIHNNGYAVGINRNRDYRNVSMEVMNYEPARLKDVLYGKSFEASRDSITWENINV